MSDTPETDALAATHDEADPAVARTSGYSDLLEFAQALEIELSAAQAEVERLRAWIVENTAHYGHRMYCTAIRGPDCENWYEHERCDCGRNALLDNPAELGA